MQTHIKALPTVLANGGEALNRKVLLLPVRVRTRPSRSGAWEGRAGP